MCKEQIITNTDLIHIDFCLQKSYFIVVLVFDIYLSFPMIYFNDYLTCDYKTIDILLLMQSVHHIYAFMYNMSIEIWVKVCDWEEC